MPKLNKRAGLLTALAFLVFLILDYSPASAKNPNDYSNIDSALKHNSGNISELFRSQWLKKSTQAPYPALSDNPKLTFSSGLGLDIHIIDDRDTGSTGISDVDPLLAEITDSTSVLCHGARTGSLKVTASGGVPPYAYEWSHGGANSSLASGLAAGSYTVKVSDAAGAEVTRTANLLEKAPFLVTVSHSVVEVGDRVFRNAVAQVDGGKAPFSYSWSPSGGTASVSTALDDGTTTVTVTDANGCTATNSITLEPMTDLGYFVTSTSSTCNGSDDGTATHKLMGGSGVYTYLWNTGQTTPTITGLKPGLYTVQGWDSEGRRGVKHTINVDEPLPISLSGIVTNATPGNIDGKISLTASGGNDNYSYLWTPGNYSKPEITNLAPGAYSVLVTDAKGCSASQSFAVGVALSAFITSQANVSCFGGGNGSATVTATGGTAPYSYSWAPFGGIDATATGLMPGTYTVTVQDNAGGQTTANVTITQPAEALTYTHDQSNVTVNGRSNGSATVTPAGGTAPYTYSWFPSGGTAATASNLTAGQYRVTITDKNGCSAEHQFDITQPTALVASTVQTDIACNGSATGALSVTPTGGVSPYTYLWSNGAASRGITNLAAGDYTVVITDANGATISKYFTVAEPAAITVTTSQTDATGGLNNGSASVVASGGVGGFYYSWAPSGGTGAKATGLAPGEYTVTITDAYGCSTTRDFTITGDIPISSTGSQTNVTCNGGNDGTATVVATGGVGAYTYSWAPSGGTAATASGLTVGIYTVTINDEIGQTDSKQFIITQPGEIQYTSVQVDIAINGEATGDLQVNPVSGGGPFTYLWSNGATTNRISGLVAGDYSVAITNATGCSVTRSFTITQPPALTATTSQTNVSCNGGTNASASVVVSGGVRPYSYSWSPTGGNSATATGLQAGTYTVTVTDDYGATLKKTFEITHPEAISLSMAQTNITTYGVNDGTATVTATGGTAPYTYSWSPSGGTAAKASGLYPFTYTVSVTDANGCSASQSVTIADAPLITAVTSKTDILCHGSATGSASVTVSGGAAPYSYSWAPSGGTAETATGLAAGNYQVTVTDANGFELKKSFTINEPAALVVSPIAQTNIAVHGTATGSATVMASGGSAPYNYFWAPSGGIGPTATGLIAGTYTVTVTDANLCEATQSFTITEPEALTATLSQTNVSCNGGTNGSASIAVQGGVTPYMYAWSPVGGAWENATGLAAGTYKVTVTDAYGATLDKEVTITQPAAIALSGSLTNVTAGGQNDGTATVTATGGTGPYNYVWAPSGGTMATASGLSIGTYTVTVYDVNGCFATRTFTITEPVTLGNFSIPVKQYGDAPFAIKAPSSNGNGVITYSGNNNAVATVSGSTITILKPGVVTITASQEASGDLLAGTISTTLIILPKDVSLSLLASPAIAKVYDGNTAASVADANYQINGRIGNDQLSVSGTATYDNENAGIAKTVTLRNVVLTGAQKDYYNLTTILATTTGSVTKKTISPRAAAITKVYDGTDAATVSLDVLNNTDGLITGDQLNVQFTSAAYDNKNAGADKAISITGLQLSGNDKDNYQLGSINLTGTVTPAPLTITADDKERFAGTANPEFTVQYSGFVNSENTSALAGALTVTTTATINSPMGQYPINPAGLTAANYSLTFIDGVLNVKAGAPSAINLAAVTLLENSAAGTQAGTFSSVADDPGATFTYTLVNGAGDTDNALFAIAGSRLNTAAVLDFEQKQSYSVRVRSTTQYGLSLDKVFSITLTDVNEVPTLAAIADQLICYTTANQTVALSGITAGPEAGQTTTVSVSSSNANLFSAINASKNGTTGAITYRVKSGAIGTATITVTVKDNGGVANGGTDTYSRSFTITVNDLPVAAITSDKGAQVSKGETIILTATGGVSYEWRADNSIISGQNTASLTVRPRETTTYMVTATNASGCKDVKTFTITVLDDIAKIKATNILTPNGDGVNDTWVIDNIDFFPNNKVRIFDKTGRALYSKDGYDNGDGWNGMLNGLPLEEGTYFYVIDFGNNKPSVKGYITIIKQR